MKNGKRIREAAKELARVTGGNAKNIETIIKADAPAKQKLIIKKVTVKHAIDTDPDTSWMGEYGNKPETEYAIDRKHNLDCPVNNGSEGLLWYSTGSGRIELQMTLEQAESVSHSGQCDEDVLELSKVPEIKTQLDKIDPATLAADLKEFGAWDETELADHAQNLQRILWNAGCNIAEERGCDCGGQSLDRNSYRYFNGPVENYKGEPAEEIRKYVRQDYERVESLNNQNWYYMGIGAEAEVWNPKTHVVQTIHAGGLWGIESDSEKSYIESVEQEQLAELKTELTALGFSKRAIAKAFQNIERKD